MNISKYLGLRYDINSRNGGVNCWTLYAKVIKDEFGLDVPIFRGATNSKDDIAKEFSNRIGSGEHNHVKVDSHQDFDLVIFKYKLASREMFHCGIWFKGKVLHANGSGMTGSVWYDKIKDIKHDTVEFYRYELI